MHVPGTNKPASSTSHARGVERSQKGGRQGTRPTERPANPDQPGPREQASRPTQGNGRLAKLHVPAVQSLGTAQ